MPFPKLQVENQNDNSKTKLFAFSKTIKNNGGAFYRHHTAI
jgi:hypothetical protein